MMTPVSIAGLIPLAHAVAKSAVRRSRGPWVPSQVGPYTLPREVFEHLRAALGGCKNRDAAFALAVFLARFWSTPKGLLQAFPIDRRALTDHQVLGLSEACVRGALKALEEIGFIDRALVSGSSRYRPTEAGLRRKPVLWRFGSDFAVAFGKANHRRRAAQSPAPARRPIKASTEIARPVPPLPMTQTQVAQKQISSERGVFMGEEKRELNPELERALATLRTAIEIEGKR